MLNCSFTGHRDVENGHINLVTDRLRRGIEYVYNEGCRNFLTGGAVGFDTMAAKEVILFRMSHTDVRLILVIPCKEQDKSWSCAQRDMYNYILSMADEIVYTGEEYTPHCMKRRNMYLAKNCDVLICYLGREMSGAGQTARMAEGLGKRVYNIYPVSKNL